MKQKKLWLVFLSVILALLLTACGKTKSGEGGTDATEKVKIEVWGVNTLSIGSGNKEMIDAFNATHDYIEIIGESSPTAPGYETQDLTKLIAAISAGDAPDVVVLNAPFIMEVAARHVLEPLNIHVENSGFDMSQFYQYTIDAMIFEDELWGLPSGVDSRYLYYNKKHFEVAGLDPDSPPKSWDELLEYAEKLTITNDKGEMEQIGFIPNHGNSWLYLYLLQNGGQMISEDGLTSTLNAPEVVEALEFMVEGYDLMGGAEKLNAYLTAFATQTGANDPLLAGDVSMVINGNWSVATYARYGEDMMDDIGYAYAPTPTGDNFLTWSGGWAYGIPKGSKHPAEAFEVISWLVTQGIIEGAKGISAYNLKEGLLDIPRYSASKPINKRLDEVYLSKIENPHIVDMVNFGIELLDISNTLPIHPLGQFIWAEHARAIDNAIYKKMTPQEALDLATKNCQVEIDKFWKNYERPTK